MTAGHWPTPLEKELLFDVLNSHAGQGEVGATPIEDQVKEDAFLGGRRTDDVVLLYKGDEDVFNATLQSQLLHDLHLGIHDFRVAGRRHFDVNAGSAGSENHSALRVDYGRSHSSVQCHQGL